MLVARGAGTLNSVDQRKFDAQMRRSISPVRCAGPNRTHPRPSGSENTIVLTGVDVQSLAVVPYPVRALLAC